MSADNILRISKIKDKYVVKDCFVESKEGLEVGKYDTLEEAIREANKYMSEEIVEYGLDISI